MSRRSAARLLALAVLLGEVVLGVVLIGRLPPSLRSSLIPPRATATPAGTATPATTTTPNARARATGTYWTCESNESDSGRVTRNAPPPPGAVSSPLCASDYGRQGPGQPQPPLPAGIEIWRVPVGNFTPFLRCGVRVVNVVDPYDAQAAPRTWPKPHKLLFDGDWNRVQSGTC